jgi:hypothetical protein
MCFPTASSSITLPQSIYPDYYYNRTPDQLQQMQRVSAAHLSKAMEDLDAARLAFYCPDVDAAGWAAAIQQLKYTSGRVRELEIEGREILNALQAVIG